jgi:Fic family protein
MGRLLLTFFLCEKGYLTQPLLYLSEFFDRYRDEYYSRLLAVSQAGDWRGWIDFFARGVANQAKEALSDAKRILELHSEYEELLMETKKIPESAHTLVNEIFENPFISVSGLSKRWDMPFNSIKRSVSRLVKIGILRELDQRRRNKIYYAPRLLELLTRSEKQS